MKKNHQTNCRRQALKLPKQKTVILTNWVRSYQIDILKYFNTNPHQIRFAVDYSNDHGKSITFDIETHD